jgi:hypothetical protein
MLSGLPFIARGKLQAFACARLRISVHLCKGPECRRFSVAHRWLRKDGIFLNHVWMCSAGCFEAAVVMALAGSGRGQRYTMPRLPRMPFRLVLLQAGVISEGGLEAASAHAERTGASLGQALLELALLTEAELAAALAIENGSAYYALPPAPLPPHLQLPNALAERYAAATVHGGANRVVVGFVHRIDRGLLAMIEQMTGRKAEGCFITATHREGQLAFSAPAIPRASEDHVSSKLFTTRTVGRPQAARNILENALRIGAETVSLGRTGETVWVRFCTGSGALENSIVQLAEEPAGLAAAPAMGRFASENKKKRRVP